MEKPNAQPIRWHRRGAGSIFSALSFVGLGAFWLLHNLNVMPGTSAKVIIPGLVILAGITNLFNSRRHEAV